MWIALNNGFFSFVSKDCSADEIMVRARRPGDIERVFGVSAPEFTEADYHYRAPVKRLEVARVLLEAILSIDYSNFKDSVEDRPLHDAYLSVWHAMARLQPNKPYSGKYPRHWTDDVPAIDYDYLPPLPDPELFAKCAKKAKKQRAKP